MVQNPSDYRKSPLRVLTKGHPYYKHAASALGREERFSATPEIYLKNVVSIRNTDIEIGGTGLLLNNEGFVLTCLHLVGHLQRQKQYLRKYHIKDSEGKEFPLDPTFFAWDENHDLAVFRVLRDSYEIPTIYITERDPHEGEELNYFVFPDGRHLLAFEGKVQSPSYDLSVETAEGTKTRPDSFIVKGEGRIGFSGAPMFSRRGECLGNLFAGEDPGEESSIFVTKGRYINTLLRAIQENLRQS